MIGAIYVLFGMAILAMCFDLMQEEIVAKFRWIGRKIGIYDKQNKDKTESDDTNSSKEKNESGRPDPYDQDPPPFEQGEKWRDDDFEKGWSTQRSSSGNLRKLSPRNNTARVHPMPAISNESSLHQRAMSGKEN